MTQSILPFKLDTTSDKITSQAGLTLLAEFMYSIGFVRWINTIFPLPGSHNGYLAQSYILPFILMLHGGGRHLEDLRQLRDDPVLPHLIQIPIIPSSDASGNWLRRQGHSNGQKNFLALHQRLLQQSIKRDNKTEHTLDLDASLIEANKQTAQYTYKGFKGYDPLIAHLDGYIGGWLFRAGNASPKSDHLELIEQVQQALPVNHHLTRYRSDSAGYQANVINYLEDHQIHYAIAAVKDPSIKKAIQAIPEGNWEEFRHGEVAEITHSMQETRQSFRLIIVRKKSDLSQTETHQQLDLFEAINEQILYHNGFHYHAIASNFPTKKNAEKIVLWYAKRGDASENRLKELKIGFGMERMPCGQQEANAIFFALGCLAYNLFVSFKAVAFNRDQQRQQVQTVRWQLYAMAGKMTSHARQCYLKVKTSVCRRFAQIRQRYLAASACVT